MGGRTRLDSTTESVHPCIPEGEEVQYVHKMMCNSLHQQSSMVSVYIYIYIYIINYIYIYIYIG